MGSEGMFEQPLRRRELLRGGAGFEPACKSWVFSGRGPHRGPHAAARIARLGAESVEFGRDAAEALEQLPLVTRPQPRGKCGNPRSSARPADRCRGGSRRAHAELDRASDKLVRLIAEASRGAGGRSDCTLWMEMWARACRKDTASTISGSGFNSGWVVLDARPQFVTALDPGLTGQSV